MRKPLVIVAALVGSLLLSSCTGTPDGEESQSTPSATASPSVSATPTAVAEAPAGQPAAPASIIIGVSATDFVDASSAVLLSITYTSDGDEAVARVTELLGAPTSTENIPQDPHYFETDISRWDGFEIGVRRPSGEAIPKTPFYVEATSAEVSGIAIAAVDGTQVGDSFDEALVGLPEFQTFSDPNYPARALALQLAPDEPQQTNAYGLIAEESPEGGAIGVIKAPDYMYDAA